MINKLHDAEIDITEYGLTLAEVEDFLDSKLYTLYISDLRARFDAVISELLVAPAADNGDLKGFQYYQGEAQTIGSLISYFDDIKQSLAQSQMEAKNES